MPQPLPTSRRADGQDEREELDAKLRFESAGGTDQPEPQTKHGAVATTAEAPTRAAGGNGNGRESRGINSESNRERDVFHCCS